MTTVKRNKVLVTGGSGMVGQTLQTYVTQLYNKLRMNDAQRSKIPEYHFISSKDCDLRNKDAVEKLFKENQYTNVIHLAAKVGGLYMNMKANVEMLTENLHINMNILEMCHKYNVQRGVFCLSSCIYPIQPPSFPMTETMLCASEPHDSNEGYAYAKRMLYIMCKHYNKQYKREYICLSPVNLYGPYDNYHLKDSHVIPGLTHRMYLTRENKAPYTDAATNGGKFRVFGTGKAERQFLFTPDFASIIHKVLWDNRIGKNKDSCLLNICDEREYKIHEVVESISNHLSFPKKNIYYDTSYSDGCMKKTVSNARFRHFYPDYTFVQLDDGLKITTDWFEKNIDTIRK